MYSPKIREDLIPKIYERSKKEGRPMTIIVDEILRKNLRGGNDMPKCRILGCNEYTESVTGLCFQHECVVWSVVHGKK